MTEMAPFNAKQSGQLGSDCEQGCSLHCCIQTVSRTSSLFSCTKLITYLNVVLRLRVRVVWRIPVFGMTPHSETQSLCSLHLSYPIPTLYIYTDYKLTGCCYVKLFQLKICGKKMPSGYNSHLFCCLCVTVTHFMCCDLWSDTAQRQTTVQCCNMLARPGSVLPALYTIIMTYSGTQNEVYSVQQWSSGDCSG